MLYGVLGVIHLILFIIAAFEILTSSKPLINKVLWLLVSSEVLSRVVDESMITRRVFRG